MPKTKDTKPLEQTALKVSRILYEEEATSNRTNLRKVMNWIAEYKKKKTQEIPKEYKELISILSAQIHSVGYLLNQDPLPKSLYRTLIPKIGEIAQVKKTAP